jgi:uncharacterized protein
MGIRMRHERISISIDSDHQVSGLLIMPGNPLACFVLAHGAGAGMTHPFMTAVANGLAERHIATLRYQFPYMEDGLKRPDRPALTHATVRAATLTARTLTSGLPLVAGGKSFGARMTSQAQAADPLPGVLGLIFLGFPLHPAGKPSVERGQHLTAIKVPMLFLQGTRDSLASMELLVPLVAQLGRLAILWTASDADHSFHVLARSGKTDQQLMQNMLDTAVNWIRSVGIA